MDKAAIVDIPLSQPDFLEAGRRSLRRED